MHLIKKKRARISVDYIINKSHHVKHIYIINPIIIYVQIEYKKSAKLLRARLVFFFCSLFLLVCFLNHRSLFIFFEFSWWLKTGFLALQCWRRMLNAHACLPVLIVHDEKKIIMFIPSWSCVLFQNETKTRIQSFDPTVSIIANMNAPSSVDWTRAYMAAVVQIIVLPWWTAISKHE
jgi:hypothetical protein